MNLAPLDGLVLRTPRLELRLGTREELFSLGSLAEAGIHPPDEMPFAVAWTDGIGQPDFVANVVEYNESTLRAWEPRNWTLNLLVLEGGEICGSQGMSGVDFADERTVSTGSWLGRRWQGRGYGTEMRAAVLELAFRGLGAEAAISGAIVGNEASRRVSEKLGYRLVGTSSVAPRGDPVDHYDFRIERARWSSPVEVEIEGLEPCLPLFGLP